MTAYKLSKQLESQSFIKYVGEDRYKEMVKFILHYVADLEVPIKRLVLDLVYYIVAYVLISHVEGLSLNAEME